MEFVSFIDTRKGKKLLKVFKSQRAANMFLKKNMDNILSKSGVDSIGSMSKKEWDTKEAKYAIEGFSSDAQRKAAFANGYEEKDKKNESVNEGISVFDERHFGKKGIIIMIDDNGKKVSAIFKDKKNADKFNRNKPSDIKKLLQLAKKTKYPKAIDESVNEDRNSNMFYVLYQKKGKFGKPAAAGYKDRKDAEKFAKSLGSNHNTMILDKQSMKNVKGVDVKESVNEVKYDTALADFNKELEKNSEVKKAAKHYKKSTKDVVKALQSKIKVNRYSDKSIKQISIAYKEDGPLSSKVSIKLSKDYKQNESVNESASKEAMGIAALTGTRGSAVQDFIDKNRINSRKLFNALKKANLQGRINFASALAGKPGNPNAKLTIKLFGESVNEAKFGYKTSTASYIKKHKDEYKQAEKMNKGNEMKFYDMLQQMEDKVGHPKTMLFISNALRGYGVDMYKDPKIKNPADAQEALFLLSK